MSEPRIDITGAVAALTPGERLELEDAAVSALLREKGRRARERNPEAYEIAMRDARVCVEAILGPEPGSLSPEAAAAVRRACAEVAADYLAEREG